MPGRHRPVANLSGSRSDRQGPRAVVVNNTSHSSNMTDQINDQISAFIDNELSADESALLVRRFERDTEARARAMRYTLIGASLRGELLEPHPSVLRQRISSALSGNATPI